MYPTFAKPLKEDDTLPDLVGQFPFDVTGWTITLRMRRPTTTLVKSAAIDAGTDGTWRVTWSAGDLVAGDSMCEVVAVNPSGKKLTSPTFVLPVEKKAAP